MTLTPVSVAHCPPRKVADSCSNHSLYQRACITLYFPIGIIFKPLKDILCQRFYFSRGVDKGVISAWMGVSRD